MRHDLPELPYPTKALEPFLSAETLEVHHGRHHRAYVTKLNELIAGTPDENRPLEDLVRTASGALFNQAAQAWNHAFLWDSMTPGGGGSPTGKIGDDLTTTFGGAGDFEQAFKEEALGHFGSGWVWLVRDAGELRIVSTHDADSPLRHGLTPLLTLDVWEHAYYIDYRNDRAAYVEAFLQQLVNWEFAARNDAGGS